MSEALLAQEGANKLVEKVAFAIMTADGWEPYYFKEERKEVYEDRARAAISVVLEETKKVASKPNYGLGA